VAHRFSAAPSTSIGTHRLCASQADYPLPSRSRIAALLKAEHLTRRYQKHSELPLSPIQQEGAPHDEWELDAQGRMHVAGVGNVSLITIIDTVSRLKRRSGLAWTHAAPCLISISRVGSYRIALPCRPIRKLCAPVTGIVQNGKRRCST
jgi:hypothetical protein